MSPVSSIFHIAKVSDFKTLVICQQQYQPFAVWVSIVNRIESQRNGLDVVVVGVLLDLYYYKLTMCVLLIPQFTQNSTYNKSLILLVFSKNEQKQQWCEPFHLAEVSQNWLTHVGLSFIFEVLHHDAHDERIC